MLHIGFLDHLVLTGQLEEAASEFALRIAGFAPLAVRGMKALLMQAAAGGIDSSLARDITEQCLQSQDLQEGLGALQEKRQPRFKGN
jgi:enoyl-CoA hydratase/carnithine racemase